MATYQEIHALFTGEEVLVYKIQVAAIEAARIIAAGEDSTDPPWDQTTGAHDDRVRWAGRALANTGAEANKLLMLMLAENKDLTVEQIRAASDAAIQSNVNAMIDVLAKALGL